MVAMYQKRTSQEVQDLQVHQRAPAAYVHLAFAEGMLLLEQIALYFRLQQPC